MLGRSSQFTIKSQIHQQNAKRGNFLSMGTVLPTVKLLCAEKSAFQE
jgi:hypothetical protein